MEEEIGWEEVEGRGWVGGLGHFKGGTNPQLNSLVGESQGERYSFKRISSSGNHPLQKTRPLCREQERDGGLDQFFKIGPVQRAL